MIEDFREALPTLKNRARPLSPDTLEMYGYHFGHFLRIFGEHTPLARIDATAVDDYIKARRTDAIGGVRTAVRTVGANTVSKELRTLRMMLVWAKRQKILATPVDEILPAVVSPEYTPGKRWLPLEGLWRLFDALLWPLGHDEPPAEAGPARVATCCFLIGLGADWCAVARAEPGDFRDDFVLVRGTKNSHRWADVPIVPPFVEMVVTAKAWLETRGRFPSWVNACRDLAAACKRAGVPRVTPRDLRRSHGKILRARGVDPHLIGAMLRHADGRMAERVYAGIEPEDLARLVRERTG